MESWGSGIRIMNAVGYKFIGNGYEIANPASETDDGEQVWNRIKERPW